MNEYGALIGVWVRNDAGQIDFDDLSDIYQLSLLTIAQPDLREYDLVGVYPSPESASEAIDKDYARLVRASLAKLVMMGIVEEINGQYRLAGRVTP